MELDDKIVVITGAGRGIGFEAARQMALAGSKIVISDINEETVFAAADAIRDSGGAVVACRCDVSSSGDIHAMKTLALQSFGVPDLVINNAAAQQVGPGNIDDIKLDHWNLSFDINVLGSVRVVEAFLPEMRARGSGYMINTASSLAIRPNGVVQHLMPYVTSKGAVQTFTYALAYALSPLGIKVSLFCPGLTQTTKQGPRVHREGWMTGVREDLVHPGTLEDCVAILLSGIRKEAFLISSDLGYEAAIVRFAEHGLDPLSDFQ